MMVDIQRRSMMQTKEHKSFKISINYFALGHLSFTVSHALIALVYAGNV